MSNPFDSPELKEYLAHAEKEMLPKMLDSSLCVTINSDKPDIKQMLEVGAAILYDKPLILAVPEGTKVSANLKRCATTIVVGNFKDPKFQTDLAAAIKSVLKNDVRAK